MEYILGSIFTLVIVIALNQTIRKSYLNNNVTFEITQSYLFKILSEYEDKKLKESLPDTQSFKHVKNQYVKIIIVDNEAYWIKDNQLYVADINDGEVDAGSTKKVDTMAMSAVELDKTISIVETLSKEN